MNIYYLIMQHLRRFDMPCSELALACSLHGPGTLKGRLVNRRCLCTPKCVLLCVLKSSYYDDHAASQTRKARAEIRCVLQTLFKLAWTTERKRSSVCVRTEMMNLTAYKVSIKFGLIRGRHSRRIGRRTSCGVVIGSPRMHVSAMSGPGLRCLALLV